MNNQALQLAESRELLTLYIVEWSGVEWEKVREFGKPTPITSAFVSFVLGLSF